MQQPQRSGKPRGSQTAREVSSHGMSESRKDMAQAKASVKVIELRRSRNHTTSVLSVCSGHVKVHCHH